MILDYRIDVPVAQVTITSLDLVNKTASGTFLNCSSNLEVSLGNLTTAGENWTVTLPNLTPGTQYSLVVTGSNPFNSATAEVTKTAPTYSINASPTTVNEGDTVTFTVTTTGVPEGTTLDWSLSGTVTGADFVTPSVTGTITIDALGTATFTKTASTADEIDEGVETFTITILDPTGVEVATSEEVSIQETPSVPQYTITADLTSINEGSTVTFTVTTTNIPDNTELYYSTASGVNINAADFQDNSLTGTVTIIGNSGTITRNIATDLLNESAEDFLVQLRTDSINGTVVATSGIVTITNVTTHNYPATVLRIPTSDTLEAMGSLASYNPVTGQSVWPVAVYDSWIAANNDRLFLINSSLQAGSGLILEVVGRAAEGWNGATEIKLCGPVYTEVYGYYDRAVAESKLVENTYPYNWQATLS